MKKIYLVITLWWCHTAMLCAQETFPRNDVYDERAEAYIFRNARIIVSPDQTITSGSLKINKGKIEQVGSSVPSSPGYIEIDLEGKSIYPSFIDLNTHYGLPKVNITGRTGYYGREQINSATKGAFNGNEAIKAEYNASDEFTVTESQASKMRGLGFGTVLTFRPDGVARGSSALVTLGKESENKEVLKTNVAAHYSFDKGTSKQSFPVSAMGYIALLRQTYFDAQWYSKQGQKPYVDKSIQAWVQLQPLPQIFETGSWQSLLRADKVGDEFNVSYIIAGSGDEYKRIDLVKKAGNSLILPLKFPEAIDVDDPLEAVSVPLSEMLHWEMAPSNLQIVNSAGISFSLTAWDNEKDFFKNLRSAIKRGLPEKVALEALTVVPAGQIRMESSLGKLNPGMIANFIITSGNVFEEDVVLYENWIQGKPYIINSRDLIDLSGNYTLAIAGKSFDMEVTGKPAKPTGKIKVNDSTEIKMSIDRQGNLVNMVFDLKDNIDKDGVIRLSGWKQGQNLKGTGTLGDGEWLSWNASYVSAPESKSEEEKQSADSVDQTGQIRYPFVGLGVTSTPALETVIFKNATVWTNEADGIMEETDVKVKNGKIAEIGKDLQESGARIIDATGKHLTSGIIDEHTHIAATSINDIATNSGMVRMGDVLDSEDINIYRQLAGGVTAAQVLHGSANPIGGQSALIKLRWGEGPEGLKIDGADKFIKFALGENVKKSRSVQSIRYPQTRMGVEQVYMDAFTNALEYEKKWKAYNQLSTREKNLKNPPRRDLVHETMLEIINGERFITCHSYVQSEINMLMHVADKFDFNVNTFTHILEGYKVADKMAEHGVGGSTFADWWAYKWEVRYAIPYNPILMHMAGVTVAINSDDAEMARRLNQEAAKSVKYGGMSEEDAWKMVTLNPAKLLHLDNRMGSIKAGKDGDLVLWSDHPLSIYAKAEKTMIDGRVYYDIESDQKKREELKEERARLVQKLKSAKKGGASVSAPSRKANRNFHCDDIIDEALYYNQQ